jgi:O-antigen ligase/tetratricopeptide (TPR) repeat protein
LALARLDWLATALIAVVLLIAPVWATSFPTPPKPTTLPLDLPLIPDFLGAAMEVWSTPLILLCTIGAFCLIAVREWKRPVAIGAVPGLSAAAGLLAVWAIFSAAPNPAIYLSLNALSVLFAALLLGGLVSRLARDNRALGVLVLAIALAGSVIAGIGVQEYLGNLRDGVVDHRTFSTFGPDFLAGYLLLTIPLTLAAFASASQRSLRLALGVGLALQSGCIFLTGSRAGTAIALAAVVGWAVLAVFMGAAKTRMRWLAAGVAIFVLASILSAAPTLGRYGLKKAAAANPAAAPIQSSGGKPAEDSQGHSGAFRVTTWTGTVRMAMRNPLVGTGIGTFAIDYPKYADTTFTAHAHNSFLQWTAETGFPGMILLLAAFGSASAFCLHIVLAVRARRGEVLPAENDRDGEVLLQSPELLLCGTIASLTAATLQNMFDSDLYIVATLITFCAVFGLAIAQARALAPLATQKPRAVGREIWGIGLAACLFLVVRADQIGFSRWDQAQIPSARERDHSGAEAIDLAHAAAAADPFDPEPHIALGQLLGAAPESEREFQAATRSEPGGRTYYLLGRHYRDLAGVETDRLRKPTIVKSAIDSFEKARAYDPHNLSVLRALADTEFEAGSDQNDPELITQARFFYQTMAALETAPFGRIRPLAELIEVDYAFAHDGLARIAEREHKPADAEAELFQALRILREYWPRRIWNMNLNRSVEKRKAIADLYIDVLSRTKEILTTEGKTAEATALDAELAKVKVDRAADDAKSNAAGG